LLNENIRKYQASEKKQTEEALSEPKETLDIKTNILNNLDALIYVSDIDTSEILFVNDYMKQHFGIEGDVLGQPCYKIFYEGREKRCKCCPCPQFAEDPDKVIVWEEQNTKAKRYYRNIDKCIDWADGKKARLQFSYDITDIRQSQKDLENLQNLTNALNRTSVSFLSQHEKPFEDMMAEEVRHIADIVGIDRVSVWRNCPERAVLHTSQIYRWERKGGTMPPLFTDITYADYTPSWEKYFVENKAVNSPVRLMPEEEAAKLKKYDMVSVFAAPVYLGNFFWGFVLFEDHHNERYFKDDYAEVMCTAAFLFANAVIHHKLRREVIEANERIKVLLDSTPLCCQLWDKHLNVIDCNEAAVRLYGFKDKQEYVERFLHDCSPVYQPDGQRSDKKAVMLVSKVFDEGYWSGEWMHQMPDGTPLPAEVTLVRVDYKGDYLVAGYTRDLREHVKMLSEIEQRDNLLHAVNRAAGSLLTAEDNEKIRTVFLTSLELVGRSIEADRVQIWQNKMINGDLHFVLSYEWLSEVGKRKPSVPEGFSYSYKDKPEWESLFLHGGYINKPLSQMSQDDQEFLGIFDIKTIVIIPLFLKEQFWGFFSIDDCIRERVFTEEEIDILRSISLMIANAINRRYLAAEVEEAHNRTKILLDTTPLCCQLFDSSFRKIDCNHEAIRLFGFKDKQEFLKRSSELYPEFQPDGERSADKVVRHLKEALEEGSSTVDWTYKMLDGTAMPAEVTIARVQYRDDFVLAVYIRDLRIIRKMENNIRLLESEVDKIYYDALTGIYNRRFFDETINNIIKTLSRSGDTLSLMMIDIDFFKKYNDTYGHCEGDNCLKTVVKALSKRLVRGSDFIARYGGEEFVVVLPNTSENGARVVAERLLEDVRSCKILHEKSKIADYVTVSIGVTTGKVKHGHTGADYVKKADELLYRSKQNGRDRYTFEDF